MLASKHLRFLVIFAVLAGALPALGGGCATMTGIVTGPFTGAVDLPAEVYRHNSTTFDDHPILFAPDVLFLVPIGIGGGPLVGLFKGCALDVQWLIRQMGYDAVFGTYEETSIWRPYTVRWWARPPHAATPAPR